MGRCLTNPCRDTARHPPLSPRCLSQSKSGQIEKCGLRRPPMKIKDSTVPRQGTSRWQRRQGLRNEKRQCAGRRRSLLMNIIPHRGLARIQKSVEFRSDALKVRKGSTTALFCLLCSPWRQCLPDPSNESQLVQECVTGKKLFV